MNFSIKDTLKEIEILKETVYVELSETAQQGTQEWHEARLGRFTASRFGDLMKQGRGKNDRIGAMCETYIYEKMAEILIRLPHNIESRATEWGLDHEEEAIEAYEKETGNLVNKCGFIEYGEYAGGSPDGLIDKDGSIEVKCPFNPANHIRVLATRELPQNHFLQVQGVLMVTGRKWCDYVSYDPRITNSPELQLAIVRVVRNEEVIQSISDRIVEVRERLDEILTNLTEN